MRTFIESARHTKRAFNANNDSERASIDSVTRAPEEPMTEVETSRQIDRLETLKVMFRSLLDELDYLTEPKAPAEEFDLTLQGMVRRFEAELIRHTLMRTGGKQRRAARLLGEKKTTLNAKIIRYGIRVESINRQPKASASDFTRGTHPESSLTRKAK